MINDYSLILWTHYALQDKLAEAVDNFIDVFKPVSLMTLDSLLKCSFSYNSNCQTEEYVWLFILYIMLKEQCVGLE